MDKLSKQDSIFTKVDEGKMRVRVVGDIEAVREHPIEIGSGKDKRFHAIVCPTEQARMEIKAGVRQDLDVPPCPLCELGYPVKTTYLATIVERESEKDGKIVGGNASILKKGPRLLGEVQNLFDNENWGSAGDYDIEITATGQKTDRKYSVVGIPADKCKPLSTREQAEVDDLLERVSLAEMTTPRPYEEIKGIIGEDFPVYEKKTTEDIPF